MKYLVCYSGGHSSALVAIEAVKKYGKDNVILLNHNISSEVEHEDIKRFKEEVAEYLGIKITYANMENWEEKTPLRVCRDLGGFKFGTSPILCTTKLKTEPFQKWLKENYPVKGNGDVREDLTILYGFDKEEKARIQRRSTILAAQGYKTDFPLAYWDRTIETEKEIGYSILKDKFLEDLEPKFKQMRCQGIVPTEKVNAKTFWSKVEKELQIYGQISWFPCECSF